MIKQINFKREFLRLATSAAAFAAAVVFLFSALTISAQNESSEASRPALVCPNLKPAADFDGDGKTDFSIVRNNGGAITWYNSGAGGAAAPVTFGIAATDFVVPIDFDGDNKSDIAVWRSGAQGFFYILQSLTGTLRVVTFGTTGDQPYVSGDYTGDGKADPAVYRAGATTGATSTWYYLASSGPFTNQIVATPWGVNGDFAAVGDYDGDGRYDFVVQRGAGGNGVFYRNRTTAGVDVVYFGAPNDFNIPGDYDGDCKTDLAVRRTVSGTRLNYIRNSTNGAIQYVYFGSTGDVSVPGDYDGDGKTDVAAWRPASFSIFYYQKSGGGSTGIFYWGTTGDIPPASFVVH